MLQPPAHPESGGYYRSDHFSFARVGVPELALERGKREPGGVVGRRVEVDVQRPVFLAAGIDEVGRGKFDGHRSALWMEL